MAKVIEFYIPARYRKRSRAWIPSALRGRLLYFPQSKVVAQPEMVEPTGAIALPEFATPALEEMHWTGTNGI